MRHTTVSALLLAAVCLLASCGSNSNVTSSPTSPGTSGNGGNGGSGGNGGGGGGGGSQPNAFLYVSETTQDKNANTSGALEAFSVDTATGALTAVSGSPFSTKLSNGYDMVLSPNNDYAYIVGQNFGSTCCVGPASLQVYSLDPSSGVPTIKQTVSSASSGIFSLAMHPSGNLLYTAPWNSDNTGIGIYTVAADGTLSLASVASVPDQDSPVITPNGKFLYTHVDGAPVGNWPTTSPCGPTNTNLYGFSIDSSTGALTPISGSPFVFQRNLCQVGHQSDALLKNIDPSSSHLFITDQANANVDVFAIDATTGALTAEIGTNTGGFSSTVMDPAGKFLYVGSIDSFTGFSLATDGTSGTLPVLPGMPYQLNTTNEEGSTTMAIDPTGTFLYSNENEYTSAFSCCGADVLVGFKLNPDTGAFAQQLSLTPANLVGSASKMVIAKPQ